MYKTYETQSISGLQREFELLAIFAFKQVITEWTQDVKHVTDAVKKDRIEQSTVAVDNSLEWLMANLPDYTTFWNINTRRSIGQIRVMGNDNLRRLIMKLTLKFWRETTKAATKAHIVDMFIHDATSVLYPIELYKAVKDSNTEIDKIKYVAEMSTNTDLNAAMEIDANSFPELVPLFYFTIFINQVMEELQP
jgi:hypothetical protein